MNKINIKILDAVFNTEGQVTKEGNVTTIVIEDGNDAMMNAIMYHGRVEIITGKVEEKDSIEAIENYTVLPGTGMDKNNTLTLKLQTK